MAFRCCSEDNPPVNDAASTLSETIKRIEGAPAAADLPPWWQAPQPAWFQRALGEPAEQHRLSIGGCDIACRCWGDPAKPALVLLHGFVGHSRWWDFAAPFFTAERYVVAPDLSGMGDSGRRQSYEPEVHGGEVLGVAEALGLDERTCLAGHSYGGFAAFLAAHEAPGRFRHLVMSDAPIRGPDEALPPRTDAFKASSSRKIYLDRDYALSRFRILPEQGCEHPYLLEHIARHSLCPEQDGWAWKFDPALLALGLVGGLYDKFAAFDAPITLIHASDSSVLLPHHRDWMRRHARQRLHCIEVPEAEHHIFLNQPIAFITALRAALDGADA